ncbi:MAG TPA: HlyD family efflux transporter periplasmic adaptor subunit [bacterium]|nr:HlyD family efflux transporter periplasmic adaptor subunit [bacterium]
MIAEARVVPVRYVSLSLPGGGAFAEVLVAEGDRVQAGQVLARLDTARQAQAAVSQADATLSASKAKLADLRSGARAQELDAARGSLDAAEAHYHQLVAGARPEEREQARMAVEQADGQVRAVEQVVRQADAELQLADADLRRIQQLAGQGAVAQQAADQARARFQTDKAADEAARAQLDVARAQAASARQQQRLVLAGPRQEEISAAAADVRRAQAQLALLQAGTRPEAIAEADANVAVAVANLKQAREVLAQTELRAPFAGIVAAIVPNLNEFVNPGAPIVRLADTSAWEIETTDLSDLSVANVRVGDPVAITFDGIPGLRLTGVVTRIQGFGETKQGDIVYKVTIKPDRLDARLRWNMTATVTITPREARP